MSAHESKYYNSYTTSITSCYTKYMHGKLKVTLCTRPVSHTSCHHLDPFHDCRSQRQHCHGDWSQLCQEELRDFHASETWLEIDLNLGHQIDIHLMHMSHVPARSTPQKTSRRKPTINTSPTTAIPAMAPGDKPGRAVRRETAPVYLSTQLAWGQLTLYLWTKQISKV